MKSLLKISLLIFLLPFCLKAQNIEGGFTMGLMTYQGDLVKGAFAKEEFNFFYGALLRAHLTEKISVKGTFYSGRLTGNDANYPERENRAFRFTSDILEFTVQGEWNILGTGRYNNRGLADKQRFTPYLFAGLGVTIADPEVFKGNMQDPEGTDYDTFHFVMPAGAGVKVGMTEKVVVGLELGGRTSFSDYLDGISTLANPGANDWYWTGNIVLTYVFGSPEFF